LSQGQRVRLFLDSNVLTAGIVSAWGLDKAVLSLCAARICRLVLAEAVREEVENNLLIRLGAIGSGDANSVLDSYVHLIALMKPEIVPFPDQAEVTAGRHLIRHAADVPVLLSAMASRPDWLLTHNVKHFTPAVARRTGLRIATPVEFFRALSNSLSNPRGTASPPS
jgi:predicted nucleic acid-binding protein